MALTIHLKYAEHLKGRAERLAKISFRGLSRYTKTVENTENSVIFDESFQWPVARPIEADEVIDIHIYNRNKYLNNRLVGTFRMVLQELIEVGNVRISDCLLDTNNVAMQAESKKEELANLSLTLACNEPRCRVHVRPCS